MNRWLTAGAHTARAGGYSGVADCTGRWRGRRTRGLWVVGAVGVVDNAGELVRGDAILVDDPFEGAAVAEAGSSLTESQAKSLACRSTFNSEPRVSSIELAGSCASSFGSTLCNPPPYTLPSDINWAVVIRSKRRTRVGTAPGVYQAREGGGLWDKASGIRCERSPLSGSRKSETGACPHANAPYKCIGMALASAALANTRVRGGWRDSCREFLPHGRFANRRKSAATSPL